MGEGRISNAADIGHHAPAAGIHPHLTMGINMRKYSLLLAVMLAASFATVADAAKKKAGGVAPDAVYE